MEFKIALYQFLNAISVVYKEEWGGAVVSAASHTCSTQGHSWGELRTHQVTFHTTRIHVFKHVLRSGASTLHFSESPRFSSTNPIHSELKGSTGRSPTMMPRWCWETLLTTEHYHSLLFNHHRHGWGEYGLRIGRWGRRCCWFIGAGVMCILPAVLMLLSVFADNEEAFPCRITS